MYVELAILALFIFLYSMVARRVERSVISDPMVFVTVGCSKLTMILTSPPHSLQVSITISNTRFMHCAQVIEERYSAGVCSRASFGVAIFFLMLE